MKEVPSCLPQGNRASKQAAPFTCLAVLGLFPFACMQSGALSTAFQETQEMQAQVLQSQSFELATENNFWSHSVEIYSNPVLQENREVEKSSLLCSEDTLHHTT